MGSFTSMAKIIPATDTDKDIEHEFRKIQNNGPLAGNHGDEESLTLDNFLDHCSKRLSGLPEPISRNWKEFPTGTLSSIDNTNTTLNKINGKEENIRVFQWNVLSQSKYSKSFCQ